LAEDRARRADNLLQESLSDLSKERMINIQSEKTRISTDKLVKDLNAKIFELESSLLLKDTNTNRRLESRIEDLTLSLEKESLAKSELVKTVRKNERIIRELEFSLSEKDKAKMKSDEEIDKLESKIKRMRSHVEELESSESTLLLNKKRVEREAMEYKDRAVR
jgi:chromosome segregation ATPase